MVGADHAGACFFYWKKSVLWKASPAWSVPTMQALRSQRKHLQNT
jgi:hypothetical protein